MDRAPDFSSSMAQETSERAGYELINVSGGGVWLTRDWSLEAYADFSLPFSWLGWRKNDPRRGVTDGGRLLRSPGCEPGQYSYMRAFDREFVQVVQLQPLKRRAGLVHEVQLEKYHQVEYAANQSVKVLSRPDGNRYILVAETVERSGEPTLPDGWTITEHVLDSDLQVDLFGEVTVIRLDNEDSFQGPLPDSVRPGPSVR
ncbi:MAG: hypothetical protein AAFV53_31835 [Myxococcota bacterium]